PKPQTTTPDAHSGATCCPLRRFGASLHNMPRSRHVRQQLPEPDRTPTHSQTSPTPEEHPRQLDPAITSE
ncbi:hypothetical protein LN996_10930, partial [Arthrobacter sp. AK01]|uniref:hypothetical protein n=1 Tax=Arthrobacter sp. AK01 TaxID=2894084 RepID=UPI001E3D38C0